MVTQDTSLLHRSVMDNILYGRPNATFEEAIAAASGHMPTSSSRISRTCRAGAATAPMSASAASSCRAASASGSPSPGCCSRTRRSSSSTRRPARLDSEVEAAIQESLYNLMEGKTVIAIAHRLSTIAALDRRSSWTRARSSRKVPMPMLRRGGIYAELWNRQSGGFIARDTAEAAE